MQDYLTNGGKNSSRETQKAAKIHMNDYQVNPVASPAIEGITEHPQHFDPATPAPQISGSSVNMVCVVVLPPQPVV